MPVQINFKRNSPASQHRRSWSRDGPAFLGFLAAFVAALASASAFVVRLRPDVRLANDADLSVPSAVALSGMSTLMWSTILTPFFKNAPRPCWVDLGGIAAELMNARVGRKCGTHAARKAMRDARTVNRDPMHAMRRGETVAVLNGIITILKVFFLAITSSSECGTEHQRVCSESPDCVHDYSSPVSCCDCELRRVFQQD